MPVMADNQLREIATAQAQEHLGNMLAEKPQTEYMHGATQWKPTLRRHIYTQQVQAWRTYDTIKARVDKQNRLVSFSDPNRFATAQTDQLQKLTEKDMLDIAGTSGLLHSSARIAQTSPSGGAMLTVTLEQPGAEWPATLRAVINTQTRLLAAFDVIPEKA